MATPKASPNAVTTAHAATRRLGTNKPHNQRAHKQVSDLFAVSNHRWPAMPPASELGITCAQRVGLIRIRTLYGEVMDEIGYCTARQCEAKLAEAEGLIAKHFPDSWSQLQLARAKRGEIIEMPTQQGDTTLSDEVNGAFAELAAG